MLSHALQDAYDMMNDAVDNFLPVSDTTPAKLLCELGDDAASSLDVCWVEESIYSPGDRQPITTIVPELPDSVEIDATEYFDRELNYIGEGSFVHANPNGGQDCRAEVSKPEWYVVDQNGRLVPGARLIVRYTETNTDTP